MSDNTMSRQVEERQIVYMTPYPLIDGGCGQEDEIDLLALWDVLWRKKVLIAGLTLLMTLVAVYVTVYLLPVTYQSQAVLLQNAPSGSGKLSGLASLAGALPIPITLPDGDVGSQLMVFLQSRDLKRRLIDKFDLLPRLYKGDWDPVRKAWKAANPKERPTATLAIQQEKLQDVYQVSQDDTTKLITIGWVDEEPAFAAEMLKQVIAELEYYLTNNYDSDATRERLFVERQLADITRELERWERQVPDSEIPLATIKREQVAASTVYAELRKQLELAKLSEEKEVVNFKVIDAPFVPEARHRPARGLICAATLLVSALLAMAGVLVHNGVARRRSRSTGGVSVGG